jgi:hypothetical protein
MDNRAQIIDAESRLIEAMQASNIEELEALISNDLVFTGHTGQVFTKQMDMEAHRTGNIKIYSIEISEQVIKLLDNVAVVSVRKDISGSFFGEVEVGIYRYTRVWQCTGDIWQVVAAHATQIVH